jgi:thiamine-monophosphate kinase
MVNEEKGELSLIRWICETFRSKSAELSIPPGDDCGAFATKGEETILATTDMLLAGVHFDLQKASLQEVGYKALACSLSDAAAMAALPIGAIVAVALNNDMRMSDAKELVRGMEPLIEEFDCPLIGGDIVSWDSPLAITVSLFARPAGVKPVKRFGAHAGDAVCVTGKLGGSIMSLEGKKAKHLTFSPRVSEARKIAQLAEVHAMIDVSDGLAVDLAHICEESGCGADIDENLLRGVVEPALFLPEYSDDRSPIEHALHDGEDFELLLTVCQEDSEKLASAGLAKRIGRITKEGLRLIAPDGHESEIVPKGYEHFRGGNKS